MVCCPQASRKSWAVSVPLKPTSVTASAPAWITVKAELNELNDLRNNELSKRAEWLVWLAFIRWAALLIFGIYMALGGLAAFATIGLVLPAEALCTRSFSASRGPS